MEAKDTVMSRKIYEGDNSYEERVKQAEISFKAGQRNILDILRKVNVRAWEDVLIYQCIGKPN